jgi:hypothetical protein
MSFMSQTQQHIKRALCAALFVLSFVVGHESAFAQKPSQPYTFGINYLPGFLIGHRSDIKNMEAHVQGVELQFKSKTPSNYWSTFYSKPQLGMKVFYMDLGLEITGKAFSIIPTVDFSLKKYRNGEINFGIGTGVGYVTEKFDARENPRNQAIGSNINAALQISMNVNHQLTENWLLSTGATVTHFSNGSFRTPNLGVNMPTATLGLHYNFGERNHELLDRDSMKWRQYSIAISYAFKEQNLARPEPFHLLNANFTYLKRKNYARDYRFGADIFIDKTHVYYLDASAPRTRLNPGQMTEIGVFAGYQWLITRISLIGDVGVYLYRPSDAKFITYQRMGIVYHASNNMFIKSMLKIHFGTADFFDFGIGYKFDKKAKRKSND